MAVSPRRVSKSRKAMRHSHDTLQVLPLKVCSNCSKYVKTHIICSCGYYRGKKIIDKQ